MWGLSFYSHAESTCMAASFPERFGCIKYIHNKTDIIRRQYKNRVNLVKFREWKIRQHTQIIHNFLNYLHFDTFNIHHRKFKYQQYVEIYCSVFWLSKYPTTRNRIDGIIVSVLDSNTVDRGFEPRSVKPNTIKLVIVASPLST